MQDYTPIIKDHFENPRNCGTLPDPDGIGKVGDSSKGDFLTVYIKVRDNVIADVKYQTRGCPVCIACASMMSEIAVGKDLDEAMMIESEDIVNALGGVPKEKIHCANRGSKALQEAIIDHVYGKAGQ